MTVAQLQARVVALKISAGLASLEPARARTFADGAIHTALLAEEARSRGLENDARVRGPLDDLLARRLIEVEVEGAPRVEAPEAALVAYYEAHREDFMRPERVRLTMLQARGPRAKTELELAQRELSALSVAAQNEVLKKRGAQTAAFTREELETRLGAQAAEAAWLLMNLERLEVLPAADSAVLVRLEERQAGRSLTVEQAREQIESRLWYEHRDEAIAKHFEKLRGKWKLQVDESALSKALFEVR